MRKDCVFFCPIRVRYNEVDQQGIVYNGHYGEYMEAAFDEFLRSKGCGYRELADGTGSEVCHKKSTYEYFSSAFEGDLLEVGVRVIRIGEKSFTLGFEVYRQGEDDLLVTGEIVFCGYDPELRRSRPITEAMRKLLSV